MTATMTHNGKQVVNKTRLILEVIQDLESGTGEINRKRVLEEATRRFNRLPPSQRVGIKEPTEGLVDNVLSKWRKDQTMKKEIKKAERDLETSGISVKATENGSHPAPTIPSGGTTSNGAMFVKIEQLPEAQPDPTWQETSAAVEFLNAVGGNKPRATYVLDRVVALMKR